MRHVAAAILAGGTLLSSPIALQAENISITEMNWDAALVITQVLKQVIENELGETVTIQPGNTTESLTSMDAGDGVHDVFPDIWMPNRQDAWDTYVKERGTIIANPGYDALQAFYMPAEFASAHGISDITDLNNADLAALFDTDGNGKGEYWAGEENWNATRLNQIKIKSYGLDTLWEPWIASNDDFKAALKEADTEGRPLLFYHWTPEWVFGIYDLQQIKEPAYTAGCDQIFTPDDRADWLAASSFPCEFETSHVYVFHSASLQERAPAVSDFLRAVTFDPDVINGWVTETGVNGRTPTEVASDWIAQNTDIVNGWLTSTASN